MSVTQITPASYLSIVTAAVAAGHATPAEPAATPSCSCQVMFEGYPEQYRRNRDCLAHGHEPAAAAPSVDLVALSESLFTTWRQVAAERTALTDTRGYCEKEALEALGSLLIAASNAAAHVRTVRHDAANR